MVFELVFKCSFHATCHQQVSLLAQDNLHPFYSLNITAQVLQNSTLILQMLCVHIISGFWLKKLRVRVPTSVGCNPEFCWSLWCLNMQPKCLIKIAVLIRRLNLSKCPGYLNLSKCFANCLSAWSSKSRSASMKGGCRYIAWEHPVALAQLLLHKCDAPSACRIVYFDPVS